MAESANEGSIAVRLKDRRKRRVGRLCGRQAVSDDKRPVTRSKAVCPVTVREDSRPSASIENEYPVSDSENESSSSSSLSDSAVSEGDDGGRNADMKISEIPEVLGMNLLSSISELEYLIQFIRGAPGDSFPKGVNLGKMQELEDIAYDLSLPGVQTIKEKCEKFLKKRLLRIKEQEIMKQKIKKEMAELATLLRADDPSECVLTDSSSDDDHDDDDNGIHYHLN